MSKQEQKKGFFGTVANLFKSDKEECCSVSFEEIEDNTAVEQKQTETQIEAKTPPQGQTQNRGCCG
jgi:hypothetical protein